MERDKGEKRSWIDQRRNQVAERFNQLHPTVQNYLKTTALLAEPDNQHPAKREVLVSAQRAGMLTIASDRELWSQLGDYVEFRDQLLTEVSN